MDYEDIHVQVAEPQPINVEVRDAQPINVSVADQKPVNVQVGEVVQISYITGLDLHYEQDFSDASQIEITHNMGKRPAITVIDTAGDEVEGDYTFIDINTVMVSFSAPFSGKVVLN